MVRYERTGEWRQPEVGEWFETTGRHEPLQVEVPGRFATNVWILRRVESPAASSGYEQVGMADFPPEPEPAKTRPATEIVLESLGRVTHAGSALEPGLTEAIRRVRAWEKAREAAINASNGWVPKEALLALLDGENAGGET